MKLFEYYLKLILLCYLIINCYSITSQTQIEGLKSLFNSTNGPDWKWKNELFFGSIWSFDNIQKDPCSDNNKAWQGVVCSSTPSFCKAKPCSIISIILLNYGLDGTLPPEFFSKVTSLTHLEISLTYNLTGSIPSTISSLVNLQELWLYTNRLTGTIPTELGQMPNLVEMFLNKNKLTGTIPTELSKLSNLEILSVFANQLIGTIPSELSLLSKLNTLYLYENQLNGTIPAEIGKLSNLVVLFLYENQLTGTIPSNISTLSNLELLSLRNNLLTGTIPNEISSLTALRELYLNNGKLTGPIPKNISFLSQLSELVLYGNILSGTIPSEIGLLSKLVIIFLDSNHLNGTIPNTIFNLSNLENLDFRINLLTGTIPTDFQNLPLLQYIYFNDNYFSGSLPSQIGYCTLLEELDLNGNKLTGIIPFSISNLTKLVYLHLHKNHLHGQIPFQLDSFPSLEQLFLQQNKLTGHLNNLFLNFDEESKMNSTIIINFDVSDNLFSGSIPSTVFLLPSLQSISLSLNCFQHKLPTSMCEAINVEIISMDGLGAAKECPHTVTIPLTTVSLVQTIHGSIPDCVWLLSNLKILNLAGNGLKGHIKNNSTMLSLLSMTLSHNYLTGVIPLWLQEKNMSQLDLSHNKLTGDLNGFNNQFLSYDNSNLVLINESLEEIEISLTLSVNRLSGDLQRNSFKKYSKLDILSGNLFGCKNLPKNDKNSEWFNCGSEEYNQTMSLMVLVLILIGLFFIFYFICLIIPFFNKNNNNNEKNNEKNLILQWLERRIIDYKKLIQYVNYYSLLDDSISTESFIEKSFSEFQPNLSLHSNINVNMNSQSTISFGYFLFNLIKSICILTIISILLSIPIYILKESDENQADTEYVTHTHMYNWLWTMAFLSGKVPAIILLCMTFFCLICFTFIINYLGKAINEKGIQQITNTFTISSQININDNEQDNNNTSNNNNNNSNNNNNQMSNTFVIITVWIIFILNISVVGTVNGLYIWSTLEDLSSNVRAWIQFSFGLFSFLWSTIIIRGVLTSNIKGSIYGMWLFVCLNVVNNVLIPCLVTSLSTPNCYQRLLVPPDDISSTYSYFVCDLFIVSDEGYQCAKYTPVLMEALKVTPPFIYSYQCGSTIVTSYIPVYMYSISLQIFSIFIKFIIIFSFNNVKYPNWLLKMFVGICWPFYWNNQNRNNNDYYDDFPIQLIKPYQIVSNIINNFILFLSFGLCSPILCGYIALSICLNILSWIMLIGRFIYLRIDFILSSYLKSFSLSPSLLISEVNSEFSIEDNHENINRNENKMRMTINKLNRDEIEGDELLNLLNQQLHKVNVYLIVCKWPVIFTSCFFITLLCWDMVGDKVGWYKGLWVPIIGIIMIIIIWMWDKLLTSGMIKFDKYIPSKLFTFPSFYFKDNSNTDDNKQTYNPNVSQLNAIEIIHSSIHNSIDHPNNEINNINNK